MLYFDSSVLVCLLSSETRTEALQAWFSKQDADELHVSDWNVSEFYSAMAFKKRTQQVTAEQRLGAEQVFEAYLRRYFKTLPVPSACFRRAAEIVRREDVNLRAPDALHLAIVEANGMKLCTLDKKMHEAAGILEIDCLMP
ncbi:MAG: PilT protein-like protein [Rhizobium sp.]|nr:PilT protein-like protein [Rhizobium sp.]